ncbi:MAG TPA: glycosyltransferase family 39 protein [Solirubrobacteraceae bacterium]|nr:glycosyltransferase family 39 protein [Solirubrobacteraceae bacterium]
MSSAEAPAARPGDPTAHAPRRERRAMLALLAITLLGAALRLVRLRYVPEDDYYDAAVRSMSLSLHNFLYGAFEPGASASIDKPPLDLWLQVISVKLFGFGPVALKLPEALGGTLAVPLLYDLVRRVAGRLAGLASAFVLAIIPLSVVSSRSDTMDSVMMALLVVSAWLLLAAVQRRRAGWLLGAAAVLGLAFNVKLFEALVPLPAFVLFFWLGARSKPLRARLARLAASACVLVAVACSWMVLVSLTPAHDRPWPIGSTNGSVWNAVFVYNGYDRIAGAPAAAVTSVLATIADAGNSLAGETPAVISPAGPLRLFAHNEIDYGGLVGTALFAALVLSALALAPLVRRVGEPSRAGPTGEKPRAVERAAIAGVAAWLILGYLLFSFSSRAHPRYLEAFTPSIAIALGTSLVVLARRARRDPRWSLLLGCGLAMCVVEAAAGSGRLSRAGLFGVALVGVALAAAATGMLARSRRSDLLPRSWTPSAVAATLLIAVIALVMLVDDVRLIRDDSGVQASEVTVPAALTDALSRFLERHDQGARYEVAVSAPTLAAPLIVKDGRPVLLLTSVYARPLVTLAQLRRDAARGAVRYVFSRGICPGPQYTTLPACSTADKWVRAHATDVTAQLGLGTNHGLLYELPSAP